jgi:hypothetical protein
VVLLLVPLSQTILDAGSARGLKVRERDRAMAVEVRERNRTDDGVGRSAWLRFWRSQKKGTAA